MKKQVFLVLMTLLPMVASADTVEIDGIYYNLDSEKKEAEVTTNPSKYTGTLIIPEAIEYEGNNYDVTSIGNSAFLSCWYLTSIDIPNSVKSIGEKAFQSCNGLVTAVVGDGVATIGENAFYYCSALKNVTFGNGLLTIGTNAFYNCSHLTSITLPTSLTSIGNSAFYGCKDLTMIVIPNNVKTISNSAFEGCGLTSVIIGKGVSSIGSRAFYGCSGLESIKVLPVTPPTLIYDSFSSYSITLYVPQSLMGLYGSTSHWSKFTDLRALEKCATPTISLQNGKVVFGCETEDVKFVPIISAPELTGENSNELNLSATFKLSVYATKDGCGDSDTATQDVNIRGLKGDVNEDGQVTITDAVGVVDIILNSGK